MAAESKGMNDKQKRAALEKLLTEKLEGNTHYAVAKQLTALLRPWMDEGAVIDKTLVRRWRTGERPVPVLAFLDRL